MIEVNCKHLNAFGKDWLVVFISKLNPQSDIRWEYQYPLRIGGNDIHANFQSCFFSFHISPITTTTATRKTLQNISATRPSTDSIPHPSSWSQSNERKDPTVPERIVGSFTKMLFIGRSEWWVAVTGFFLVNVFKSEKEVAGSLQSRAGEGRCQI